MPETKPRRYKHYLLVFWEEQNSTLSGNSSWRIRLEDPAEGAKWGFTEIDALTRFETTGLTDGEENEGLGFTGEVMIDVIMDIFES